MNEFCLSKAEKETAVWVKLKAHFEERLEKVRKQNDADLTPDQTASLRGKIAELKRILALENPPPSVKAIDA